MERERESTTWSNNYLLELYILKYKKKPVYVCVCLNSETCVCCGHCGMCIHRDRNLLPEGGTLTIIFQGVPGELHAITANDIGGTLENHELHLHTNNNERVERESHGCVGVHESRSAYRIISFLHLMSLSLRLSVPSHCGQCPIGHMSWRPWRTDAHQAFEKSPVLEDFKPFDIS